MRPATVDAAAFARLEKLLDAPGPSGAEGPAAAVWREQARGFAQTSADVVGNSYARVGAADGPAVLLLGHIDEIGLIVTHIDDDGLLRVRPLGVWDGASSARDGSASARSTATTSRACSASRPSTWRRTERPRCRSTSMAHGSTSARPTATRPAAWSAWATSRWPTPRRSASAPTASPRARSTTASAPSWPLEVARRCADAAVPVVAAAPVLEETTMDGGRVAAHTVQPAVTIVIDVTHAAIPGVDKGTIGDVRLGAGPSICRGLALHPALAARLTSLARDIGIPHVIEALPGTDSTATDVDGALDAHAGSAVGLIGLPHPPHALAGRGLRPGRRGSGDRARDGAGREPAAGRRLDAVAPAEAGCLPCRRT